MTAPHGTILWTELNTRDPEAACAYYADLLGWTYQEHPSPFGGVYRTAMLGEAIVAGIYDLRTEPALEGVPPHWFTYFAVDDVDSAAARTAEIGGAVHRPPFDVPGVGRIAVLADPSGAVMAVMQPAECA